MWHWGPPATELSNSRLSE